VHPEKLDTSPYEYSKQHTQSGFEKKPRVHPEKLDTSPYEYSKQHTQSGFEKKPLFFISEFSNSEIKQAIF
jgi:hypothetical protein